MLDSRAWSKSRILSNISGSISASDAEPQRWVKHWPLDDGSLGMDESELMRAEDGDQRAIKSRIRYAALQTIGNLTILTQALNAAVSNGPWKQKRPELLSHSLLPINQQLRDLEVWDEAAIENRSNELFKRALDLWPRP